MIFLTEVWKFHSPQLQWEAKAMPSLSCRAPLLMHILQRWIPNVSTSAFFYLYMHILPSAATYVNVCLWKKGMHTRLSVPWLQHELKNYHISLRTPQGAWNESDKTFTHFLRDGAATLSSRFRLTPTFTFTLLKGKQQIINNDRKKNMENKSSLVSFMDIYTMTDVYYCSDWCWYSGPVESIADQTWLTASFPRTLSSDQLICSSFQLCRAAMGWPFPRASYWTLCYL